MSKYRNLALALCTSLTLLWGCAALEDTTESVGDTVEDVSDDGFWDQAEGNWEQFTGSVTERWGELTGDEVTELEGNKDQLVGLIQEKYGIAKQAAEEQVDEWADSFSD